MCLVIACTFRFSDLSLLFQLAEADIIFVQRVQVTTQTASLSADASFCVPDLTDADADTNIHNAFGDSFVSGFLKGGEFASVIAIKVHDCARIQEVKSRLETYIRSLQMTTPPAVEFDVDGETEISISVRQRGGQVQLAGRE